MTDSPELAELAARDGVLHKPRDNGCMVARESPARAATSIASPPGGPASGCASMPPVAPLVPFRTGSAMGTPSPARIVNAPGFGPCFYIAAPDERWHASYSDRLRRWFLGPARRLRPLGLGLERGWAAPGALPSSRFHSSSAASELRTSSERVSAIGRRRAQALASSSRTNISTSRSMVSLSRVLMVSPAPA